jgi:tRNA 2-selenouridine synthase
LKAISSFSVSRFSSQSFLPNMSQRLSPIDFFRMVGRSRLIDARRKRDFRTHGLPNALHLPLHGCRTAADFNAALEAKIDPGETVLFLDSEGEYEKWTVDHEQISFLGGGFKVWQEWQEEVYRQGPRIIVVGGLTGTGKTEVLDFLEENDFQVLNLEEMACHRGSVFGNLNNRSQPGNGEFQFQILQKWLLFDPEKPVWVEEEGPFLGKVSIPPPLYLRFSDAASIELDRDFSGRLNRIVAQYGDAPGLAVTTAIHKLQKRMGMSANQKALHRYQIGDIAGCFKLLLEYYDRAYLGRRPAETRLSSQKVTMAETELKASDWKALEKQILG